MEEVINQLAVVISDCNLRTPQGIRTFLVKNECFILMWCKNKIHVYEISTEKLLKGLEMSQPKKAEVNMNSYVIDIFQINESVYVLDEIGVFYLLQMAQKDSVNSMEVEDLFSSPISENTLQCKESVITKVNECDKVKKVLVLSSCVAILAVKEEYLTVLIYSISNFKFKFMVDLSKYNSQDAVSTSCVVSKLSPRLKQYFQKNLDIFEEEIIVLGLASGLLLWFCFNNPSKGPFILFNMQKKIQSVHWIADSNSGLYSHLLAISSSGQVAVLGDEKHFNLYLPDSVNSSYCLNNFIVSSNSIDCYASEIKVDKELTLNSVSLPVKGVCAMTCAPGSEALLITATVHGSVYCFNPTVSPQENSTLFTLPDQSLLDNMFLQSQNLDRLYKEMNQEDDIIKAVSATVAANSIKNMFSTTVRVVSDGVFSVTLDIVEGKVVFLHTLWSICVEVITETYQRRVSFHKLEHDFSNSNNIIVDVKNSLSVGDIVSTELVCFMQSKQPLLIIPVGKVPIDACYLMCSQVMSEIKTKSEEETLGSVLHEIENEPLKPALSECKMIIKLPVDWPVNLVFKTILSNSQQRFTLDEWDKLSSGRKFTVSVYISGSPVTLKLEVESKELIIVSNSTKMCHQAKEAIAKRLKCAINKCIPESLTLNLQAIHQSLEIESLKENPSSETLDLLRKNLRASVSSQLIV